MFYIRDLSLHFWGRYLWLRRAWLSGEWPLWDPYVAAGQAAHADALHQMFLPPAILARLVGGEVLGFNLWVAIPFPLAALGTWLFLSRRFSAPASALGAAAFTLCGPVVSTGNFPNMSWSVAGLPWVMWATDALVSAPAPRRVAALAIVVALQALAGEPVTQFATLVLALGYALALGATDRDHTPTRAVRDAIVAGFGALLGLALAAIQLIPTAHAAFLAERSETVTPDLWSLRPTALLETVWLQLFGNYFTTQSLADVPWMPLIYTGREPFFFSIYFGVPLLALAVFGLAGTGPRRWRLFWVAAGFVSLMGAFGSYTPVYPILRDHVPPFGSFRFPVKFIVVACMAIAAGVAAGWDGLAGHASQPEVHGSGRRFRRARLTAIGFAAAVGIGAALLAVMCIYLPVQIADSLQAYATALGDRRGTAAEFMLNALPQGAGPVVFLSLAAAGLLLLATRTGKGSAAGRLALYVLVTGDLLVRAWPMNPVLDPAYFAQPAWLSHTKADPDARFYIGGKKDMLEVMDLDASRGYLNAPGLTGSASRAALGIQTAYYPSGWQSREMLSYDLAVLWPRPYTVTAKRFFESGRDERDRLLDRTGVRYRVLPPRVAPGLAPLAPIPYFYESFLFDFGDPVMPRLSIVPEAQIVSDLTQQIHALFEEGWDSRLVALVEREPTLAGRPGPPVPPFARFVEDGADRAVVHAGVGPGGGYLLVLDSYSDDWRVRVDGLDSAIVRANALFRVVRLPEGIHEIEFVYKPRALAWGAALSAVALFAVLGLLVWSRPGRMPG